MALQTLTTTPMPTGTETVSDPGPSDTNANSNLLGGNGPTPLVPAFILSGLLVIGMVIMCWWRRVAMRRASRSGGVGIARYGEDGRVGVIGGGRVGIVMLASGWQDEIDAMRRMRERAGEVKLGPKPLIWDVYLRDREEKERWRDMKPISAGYISSRSQSPVSQRNNSSNSPTDERRTLDSDTTTTESKSPVSPSSQAPTPQSRIRVSVLISMPTPQAHHAENNTDAPTKRKSNVSSGMEESMNKDKDNGDAEEARLGELNVALGITDVPVVQCKR